MSDASASIFKRSTKSKPRPRRERSTDGDTASAQDLDTSTVSNDPVESPMSQVAKLKARQKARTKAQTRLSFGGDDEENGSDEFKVKRSALSRKLKLGPAPSTPSAAPPTNLNQATILPRTDTTPLYSKAYLSELKASTPSTPSFLDRERPADIDSDVDVSINYDESFTQPDFSSSIPTESSIKAAREKREQLRKGFANPNTPSSDYISLSVEKWDPTKGPHPESRLAREEDELGEGEEDMAEYTGAMERIALGKKSMKDEARKKKAAMVEMIEDADDDDEETKEWEIAQAKRGGNPAGDQPDAPPEKEPYKPRPIPNITPLPSFPTAMSRLSGTLSNLQASRTVHQSNLEAVSTEQTQLEEKDRDMRDMVIRAEDKRAWFFDLKEWMETVATFLDEKFPELEKLEDEHVSLLMERYDMIARRRKENDEDDLCLFLHIPPPPPADPEQPEIDEMGRTINRFEGPYSATRVARRKLRTSRLAGAHPSIAPAKLGFTSTDDQSAFATDSDLPLPELGDYTLAREKLAFRIGSLLSDVKSDEFRDPRLGIGRRFAEWRKKWAESYTSAWGGLSLVGAWEFWARLEMAEWNPLEEPRSLDAFQWYAALYEYSRPGHNHESTEGADMDVDEPVLGPDGDLVNSMVSTAVIPRLCKLLSDGALDPYSARHMKKLIDLVEQIEICVERSDTKFQALARATLTPFRSAVESTYSLIKPSLDPSNPPPPFDPSSISSRRTFLIRRTKLFVNLLSWRKALGDSVGVDDIIRRLLVDVMLPIAQGGWDVGGQEIMSKCKSLLPKELARLEWAKTLQ